MQSHLPNTNTDPVAAYQKVSNYEANRRSGNPGTTFLHWPLICSLLSPPQQALKPLPCWRPIIMKAKLKSVMMSWQPNDTTRFFRWLLSSNLGHDTMIGLSFSFLPSFKNTWPDFNLGHMYECLPLRRIQLRTTPCGQKYLDTCAWHPIHTRPFQHHGS